MGLRFTVPPTASGTSQEIYITHQQEPTLSECYLALNLYFLSGEKPEWLSANS